MPLSRRALEFDAIGDVHRTLLDHAEVTPPHTHTRGHIVYPASGVLSLVTDSGAWIAPPNRAVWIPAGFRHQHRAHGATDMRVLYLDAALAAELPATPAVLAVTPLAREATLRLVDGEVDGDDVGEAEDGGDDGNGAGETIRPPRPSRHGAHLSPAQRARLLQVVVDDLAGAPQQPLHLPEPRDERLRAVARVVAADLASTATLDELGRGVGASERTLSRLFRAETGMGFRQWRTQLRVHRALLLLAEGYAVVDTAAACGWANPSAFVAAFTALVGRTPGAYRRAVAESRRD
jgi:AraC-like DNA-binding protein